jgi:phage antirepressor YoqD-like protein
MVEIINNEGHTENYFTVSEVAKVLHLRIDGRNVGRNIFFRILRHNKIIMDNNAPYQFWIDMNWARLYSVDKGRHTYFIPIFSTQGLNYMRNKFESGAFVINYEDEKKLENIF